MQLPSRRTSLAAHLVAALAIASLIACGGEGERPRSAELARSQWQRLVAKARERAARSRPTAPQAPAPEAPAVPPEAAPPPKRERPPRPAPDEAQLARQAMDYAAERPKTVVELQRFRTAQEIEVVSAGGRRGTATLINLNPAINAWYLLTVRWADRSAPVSYHLVNSRPTRQDLELDPAFPFGLTIVDTVERVPCDLWSEASPRPIAEAAEWRSPYRALCGDQVSLRLKTEGRRTTLEWTTDFLRDNVWRGEAITVFVRETFFRDAFLATSRLVSGDAATGYHEPAGAPLPAQVDPRFAGDLLEPTDLGLVVDNGGPGRLPAGRWVPLRANPGIFVSVLRPNLIAPEILLGHRDVVRPLDEVENGALAYLVAFDLGRFDLAYALGTDHPRLGWSDRVPAPVRDDSLPGPDGVGGVEPLVSTGIVGPAVADRTVATFTGGFKRTHGAFRTGELAGRNRGSHYGFVEQGVVFSKLQPGLATLLVLADGRVEMKTWTAADDALLDEVTFARQNGVPILAPDPATGETVPGNLVGRWALGNWSGSQEEKFRTLRAGACLAENGERRFLIYGYFSTATPSAMARVFAAYGCRYALQLDINALEHTYLAVYRLHDGELAVQHLIEGMNVLDKSDSGQELPRFLGFADNRDFFYLLKRDAEDGG